MLQVSERHVNSMIRSQTRYVPNNRAVIQHFNAGATQAANDGLSSCGAKVCCRNAHQRINVLPQRLNASCFKIFAAQHVYRILQFCRRARKRGCDHNFFGQRVVVAKGRHGNQINNCNCVGY